jgi:hypothetical protein
MKRRNIYILLILVISVSVIAGIASCKKNKNTITINGKIYDPNAGTYISGASITISSSKVSSGFYNSNYTDIATTTTDANGAFTFEFEQEKSAGYRFYITKDNYFDNTIDIPDADIQPENVYAPTFEFYPEGYLKLHVKNSSPYNADDYIGYYYDITNINCVDCCTNTVFKGYGKTYDTTYTCKAYGNNNVQVNWHVTKFGMDVAYADTIFCAPFDTTFFEILY